LGQPGRAGERESVWEERWLRATASFLAGKTLERKNAQEGLDQHQVLNPSLLERTLKGSKAVKSAKGIDPIT